MAALGAPLDVLTTPASCSRTACVRVRSSSLNNPTAACSISAFLLDSRGEIFRIEGQSRGWNGRPSGKTCMQRGRRGLQISAIYAGQEFDYDSMKLKALKRKSKPKVGIVGFGSFGQFLSERFVKQGYNVRVYSRSDFSDNKQRDAVEYDEREPTTTVFRPGHGIISSDYDDNPMEKRFGNRGADEDEGAAEDGDMLREECGVVGIFGDTEASRLCYLSLHALQHRGQEGAGIVACDEGTLNSVTGMGLVSEVFNKSAISKLTGASAVGHVRYATAGESVLKNVQPFVAGYRFGSVGVAHNGNLVNYNELRAMLEEDGSIFNTSSDTEVVLHLIAISKARPFIARLVDACQQLEGAYSMVFLTEDKLVAVRDPYGFRPLVMGRRSNGAIVFVSETCALDLIEATYEREINPGEVVVVDKEGISTLCLMPRRQRKACVFEHIYFALPNSIVFGLSVYQSRYKIGEILALESPVDCDVVIAVPDSGVVAALGYASKAGVPFQQGLIRSHYVGRTFIEPSQKIRDFGVKLKMAPVKAVLMGKRVVVVDDSIVRGTTSSKIVRLIQEAGAKEVHLRIASPPITGSCYYGVDTPSKEELISYRLSVEETRKYVGADSLSFLPLERLNGMLSADSPNFCYACFTGDYPVPPKTLSKDAVEKETAHKVLVDSNNLLNRLPDRIYGNASEEIVRIAASVREESQLHEEETPTGPWESEPLQMEAHADQAGPTQRSHPPTGNMWSHYQPPFVSAP